MKLPEMLPDLEFSVDGRPVYVVGDSDTRAVVYCGDEHYMAGVIYRRSGGLTAEILVPPRFYEVPIADAREGANVIAEVWLRFVAEPGYSNVIDGWRTEIMPMWALEEPSRRAPKETMPRNGAIFDAKCDNTPSRRYKCRDTFAPRINPTRKR